MKQSLTEVRPPAFTNAKEKFWRAKNQNGFIPMIIMIIAILAAVIWVVYARVAHTKP